ncbi:Crp/Fnr family transcriptional regulator [Methylorubrum suomiense]|uniref:HTH crp-type domain-containing protein n=1 Tax=Methylorubrum suomiense TaxID=144191 RepID=A0ABQ4V0E2_9HYPH|nr:helix-turn-helix domain-containing protein [Methylorubrum suomiense]GJE78060.1 hypothetical protein BGCPKDLD_4671 [Methylorubrum suomiense]
MLVEAPGDKVKVGMDAPAAEAKTVEMQVAMLGSDDCVGVQALLGLGMANYRSHVEVGGWAFSCAAQAARRLLGENEKAREVMLRYVDLQLAETWQLTASAMGNSNDARIAIWLLQVASVIGDTAIPVTHQGISNRMNIRRPSVTEGLQRMVDQGWIRQAGRGRLDIINVEALMQMAYHHAPGQFDHRKAFRSYLEELRQS